MKVLILNKQRKFKINDEIKNIINQIISIALEKEAVSVPVELSIVLMNNKGIKELNREYRGKDIPTDVLSFPMYDREEVRKVINHNHIGLNEVLLGDIIISMEKAYEQAQDYGHEFEREIGFLTTHGVLHLLGYDHLNEIDKKEMRIKEEQILNVLGLTRTKQGVKFLNLD